LKPILKIEDSMEQEWMAERTVDQPNIPPQLSIDHFIIEELHNVMKRNGSQVPELFYGNTSLNTQLDSVQAQWFSHRSEAFIT